MDLNPYFLHLVSCATSWSFLQRYSIEYGARTKHIECIMRLYNNNNNCSSMLWISVLWTQLRLRIS